MTNAEAIDHLEGVAQEKAAMLQYCTRANLQKAKVTFQKQVDALHFAIGALKMQVIPGTNIPDAGTPAY